MSDNRNPYEASVTSTARRDQRRLRSLLVVYGSALAAVVLLYFIGERSYFQDGVTDTALLKRALPQLVVVAALATAASTIFQPKKWWTQVGAGILLGTAAAIIAYISYPFFVRWFG